MRYIGVDVLGLERDLYYIGFSFKKASVPNRLEGLPGCILRRMGLEYLHQYLIGVSVFMLGNLRKIFA